jgi:phosphoribosylformylglycinamidine synthase
MAFAGCLGATVSLRDVPCEDAAALDPVLLFSESPSRFLLEVPPQHYAALADLAGSLPMGRLGEVTSGADFAVAHDHRLIVTGLDGTVVIDAAIADLKKSWQERLSW